KDKVGSILNVLSRFTTFAAWWLLTHLGEHLSIVTDGIFAPGGHSDVSRVRQNRPDCVVLKWLAVVVMAVFSQVLADLSWQHSSDVKLADKSDGFDAFLLDTWNKAIAGNFAVTQWHPATGFSS